MLRCFLLSKLINFKFANFKNMSKKFEISFFSKQNENVLNKSVLANELYRKT